MHFKMSRFNVSWETLETKYLHKEEIFLNPELRARMGYGTLILCYGFIGGRVHPCLYNKDAKQAFFLCKDSHDGCKTFLSQRTTFTHEVYILKETGGKSERNLYISYTDDINMSLSLNVAKIYHIYDGEEKRPISEYVGEGGYKEGSDGNKSDSPEDCLDLTHSDSDCAGSTEPRV